MPIVFSVLLLLRQSPNSFFLENYFGVRLLFCALVGTFVAVYTHYYRCCSFFLPSLSHSPFADVILYVDDRILPHLITLADASARIPMCRWLRLCYQNKRFQWYCMQFSAAEPDYNFRCLTILKVCCIISKAIFVRLAFFFLLYFSLSLSYSCIRI